MQPIGVLYILQQLDKALLSAIKNVVQVENPQHLQKRQGIET